MEMNMSKKSSQPSLNGRLGCAENSTSGADSTMSAPADSRQDRTTEPPAAAQEPAQMASTDGAAPAPPAGETNPLRPLPTLQPKRKVDLARAALPDLGSLQTVDTLSVRELKGIGAMFTPNLSGILVFLGLVYKPPGEYETLHQIITGPLTSDPRVMKYAKRIAFVPAYSWSAFEMVLQPIRLTTFGCRVLDDLKKLAGRVPDFKAFIEWDATRKRHVVHWYELTEQELSVVAAVKWPSREEILEALSAVAYDDMNDLAQANEDIRTLLRSREVE
jgi:hypothetical protein